MRRSKKINKFLLGGPVPFNLTTAFLQLVAPLNYELSKQVSQLLPLQLAPSSGGMSGIAGGIGKGAGIAEGVSSLVGMMAGPSTATTKGEAVQQSIQNVVGGVATGAKAGTAFGPVGAIVGGAAGLAAGLTGKKGKVTSGGFYEDPTMTLGTGIKGAIGNKDIRREYEKLKTIAGQHRVGATTGSIAAQEFAEDYDQDVQTMAYGGEIPSSLAYVDDGEMINTPDGNMLEVPEQGRPTDSNLVSLPEGSQILSDKSKVPGTKETFAQMGKRMMSKKGNKGKDMYAENSAKLNKMNDLMIHDKLFALQESLKGGKSNKNIRKFAKGGWLKTAGDVASNLSQLAPVFSNLNARPETFETITNPYAGQVLNTMAGRKLNIAPAERAIRENRAVSNYNASQFNPSTGANMSYRLQNAIASNKATSDLYSQKSNVENQYKAEYANALNNMGQQYVQSRNLSADINARSRASARNINRAGLTQLGQYAQNKELMRNQKGRDMAMLDLYDPFLRSIYKSDDYTSILSKLMN